MTQALSFKPAQLNISVKTQKGCRIMNKYSGPTMYSCLLFTSETAVLKSVFQGNTLLTLSQVCLPQQQDVHCPMPTVHCQVFTGTQTSIRAMDKTLFCNALYHSPNLPYSKRVGSLVVALQF